MNDFISQAPEVPEPKQLDLFGKLPAGELSEGISSYHSVDETIEHHSRDPTEEKTLEQGSSVRKDFDLNQAQKQLASTLLRKSRELVKKNYQASIQEEQ